MVALEAFDPQLVKFSDWIYEHYGSPAKALRALDDNGKHYGSPAKALRALDDNGILDTQGDTGEMLVGPSPIYEGIWSGEQLELTAIGSVNLSQFGGPILPGYQEGNPVIVNSKLSFPEVTAFPHH